MPSPVSSHFLLSILILYTSLVVSDGTAVESTWLVTGSQGEWHDPAVWLNGVPNSPGDLAILAASGAAPVSGSLTETATVGRLVFAGGTNITLAGAEELRFDNLGSSPGLAVQAPVGRTFSIQTPLGIAGGQELQLEISDRSTLRLGDSLLPGAGSVRKLGLGTATLLGGSPGWNGQVFVDAGELRIEHTRSLIDTAAVTVGPSGFLTVVSQDATAEDSRDDYAIPRLVLDGGTLQTNLGAPQQYTYVNTALELESDSTIQVTTNDTLYLQNGITGLGGVSFLQKLDPSSPVSGFDRTYLQIRGNTSYSGETFVGPNMRVAFLSSAALGDTTAGTHVLRGTLELNQGGGAEQIFVEQGELRLDGAAAPYGHHITLKGSLLSGGEEPPAVLSTPVVYFQGAVVGGESSGDDLVLAGGLSGTGSLTIQNNVEIQGPLSVGGNLFIRSLNGIRLSGSTDIAGEVFLDYSRLTLAADLGNSDLDFRLATTFETADAALIVSSSNTIGALVLDPRNANRDGTYDRSRIATEGAARLTVSEGLRFMGGTLKGNIAGVPNLVKQDRTPGWLEDIAGSSFERVDVAGGQLVIRGNVGDTPPEVWLDKHDTARILLDNVGTYPGDIYLRNSPGYNFEAALTLGGSTTFDGNLNLGHLGSSIAAGNSDKVASIGPNAVISGGDLTVNGRAHLHILGGNHTYTGVTNIRAETLTLAENGRLNSTHAIRGAGRIRSGGGRATLILNNATTVHSDRIPDATPILLEGMQLKLVGGGAPLVEETIGLVEVSRGIGDIVVENAASAANSTALLIQKLERGAGAAVRFQVNNANAKIFIDETPVLDDGLIGGWALYGEDEFATYGPNGVVPYSSLHSYATDLASAAPNSNIRLADGNVTLATDKTVNSLIQSGFSTLDLNGKTLTLESGGVLSTRFGQKTIRGGQLTAGTAANAELLIAGNLRIESNVIDNPHGAVSLIHSGGLNGSTLTLTGVNTYSGGTVVNSGGSLAALEIASSTALPVGSDVALNGGDLRLNFNADAPLPLGQMVLLDYGLVRATSNFNPQIAPESILIESGEVYVPIVGDAPITKFGMERASFADLTQHTGPIFVEAGDVVIASLGSAPLDDAHAVSVSEGGRLYVNSDGSVAGRKVNLDGGIVEFGIRGGMSAPLEILSRGATIRNGRGLTTITSDIAGTGPLTIEGGLGNGIINLGADLSEFKGDLRFTGGRITITDELNYDGVVDVRASRLSTQVSDPFGAALVIVRPEGQIFASNSLTANLIVAGGALRLQPTLSSQVLTLDGHLRIEDHSYLFLGAASDYSLVAPVISSDLTLAAGSNLVITRAADQFSLVRRGLFGHPVIINGQLSVAGSVTLTSYDSPTTIGGTIIAMSPNSTLHLVGNDTFEITGSVELTNGNSLTILEDGIPAAVEFSGADSVLSGTGTLVADATVSNGGVLAPGNSPGHLTVAGNLEIGGGAVYEWEISDPDGTAGVDWDLLEVDGNLVLSATPDDPWILRLADLSSLLQADAPLLIATAESISGFDPAAVQFEIPTPAGALSAGAQIVAFSDGANLFIAAVPEPGGLLLACVVGIVAVGRRR